VMGFMKGKSAIHIARVYAGKRRNFCSASNLRGRKNLKRL